MSWMICRGRRESVGFDADKDELPVPALVSRISKLGPLFPSHETLVIFFPGHFTS